jgi:hypothetical protein
MCAALRCLQLGVQPLHCSREHHDLRGSQQRVRFSASLGKGWQGSSSGRRAAMRAGQCMASGSATVQPLHPARQGHG